MTAIRALVSAGPVRRIGTGLGVLAAGNAALLGAGDHLSVRVGAAAALLTIPGWLLLRWCEYRARSPVAACVVAVAVSATVLMLAGLGVNVIGPGLGVDRPLARGPLLLALDAVVAALLVGALRRPLRGVALPGWRQIGFAAGVVVPVALAVAGSARLNNGGSATLALAASLAAGALLITGFVAAARLGDGQLGLLLAAATGALVVSFSTRGSYLFGYDIQQEFGTFVHLHLAAVWQPTSTGSADDAYRAMLSITVLPQVFVEICGLAPLDVFRIVLPLMVTAVPAAVYCLVRSRAPRRVAFGVAALPALLPQLASQLPAVTRQAVALAIFGALLVVLFDRGVGTRARTVLAALLSAGLVVSHYTSTYLAVVMLVSTWAVTTVVRLLARDRWTGRQAVSLVVVAWLTGFCLFWNVVVTDSVTNVYQFAAGTAGNGLQILPANHRGASFAQRWLKAPVPQFVTGPEYSELVAQDYRVHHPWMEHYDAELVASAPLQTDRAPVVAGAVPGVRPTADLAVGAVNQLLVLMIVVAVPVLVWSVRRYRDSRLELPLAAGAALVVTAAGRVSGTALESYNADRLYLQSLMVFAVALAYLLSVRVRRGRRPGVVRLGVLAMAAVVLFASTTQVAVFLIGGSPSPNISNLGEAAERYLYTDADVAVARWVDRSAPQGALIFVDRYAVLPMWNSTNRSGSVFTTLAPSAVDPRGYVVLTRTNVVSGRARGLVGRAMGVYRTPSTFYDQNKDLVYATESTRVYR